MTELTPLMKQFWEIKNQHTDKILLFRMGDFYEMFYDDAKVAAPILNIALTSRNKKSEDETPMCGVPYHSIATPISKLLAAGLKVAICDQLENPEEAKGIVKRGVTRILSPGMVYDPDSLAEQNANYVMAFDDHFISFLDASTGEAFYYEVQSSREIRELILRWLPVELVVTAEQKNDPMIQELHDQRVYSFFISEFEKYENDWPERFSKAPHSAKRLLTYAVQMQGVTLLSTMNSFMQKKLNEYVHLGTNVQKHLELFKSYRNEDRGSLFNAINRTKTSSGARKLKAWLQSPLITQNQIENRLNQVEAWTRKPSDLKILRQTLAQMGDIERRLTKISYSNCQVRDLVALMQSLQVGQAITPLCSGVDQKAKAATNEVAKKIENTLVEEPPNNMKSGGYIKLGVDATLDEYIQLSENGQKLLLELEQREKDKTQISSLKIRYNNVFGYYIEVTNTHKDKVPDHYKRKQTLANAERYITQELHELESKILSSREKKLQLEETLFRELREYVLFRGSSLMTMASAWSELDVYSSLAWLALEQKYTRPIFCEDMSLDIKGSRHPVVEQEVQKRFVPNDIRMQPGECLLLTGPNMAGKSTLMRQVALTAILAQMGSFVPAQSAELPIFEKIFTRIGASDSLSEGLSTFMVEMTEVAEMLSNTNERTLVILDEVGRGTSTYDGMSLAQAILEQLVQIAKSLTLFATHYHEITILEKSISKIKTAHMSVSERDQGIFFLYTLCAGPANKSYGIQVARLAGVPESVLRRAQHLLGELEHQSAASDEAPADARKELRQSMGPAVDHRPKLATPREAQAEYSSKQLQLGDLETHAE